RLDGPVGNALGGQPLQRLQDQRLYLVAIGGGDTLEAGGEERWIGLDLQPTAREILAEPGINQCLAERRGRRANQGLGEDGKTQRALGVAVLGQCPVDRDKAPRTRPLRAGIVGMRDATRRSKRWLWRDTARNRHGRGHPKCIEPPTYEAEALVGIIVAVAVDQRI